MVRSDIGPEFKADFNRWYNEEHKSGCSALGFSQWRPQCRAQWRLEKPRYGQDQGSQRSAQRLLRHQGYQPFIVGEGQNDPGRTELPAQRYCPIFLCTLIRSRKGRMAPFRRWSGSMWSMVYGWARLARSPL